MREIQCEEEPNEADDELLAGCLARSRAWLRKRMGRFGVEYKHAHIERNNRVTQRSTSGRFRTSSVVEYFWARS